MATTPLSPCKVHVVSVSIGKVSYCSKLVLKNDPHYSIMSTTKNTTMLIFTHQLRIYKHVHEEPSRLNNSKNDISSQTWSQQMSIYLTNTREGWGYYETVEGLHVQVIKCTSLFGCVY
jgi:hypothetical protein